MRDSTDAYESFVQYFIKFSCKFWLITNRGNEQLYLVLQVKKLLKNKNPVDKSCFFFPPKVFLFVYLHFLTTTTIKDKFYSNSPPLLFKMHTDLQDKQNIDYKLFSEVKIQLH